jgi:hypothetical protein
MNTTEQPAVTGPVDAPVRRFDDTVEDMIYRLEPVDSPFFAIFKYGRFTFRRGKGGSMRKQRRRKAKPLRFTAATRASRIVHEWHLDTLHPWPSA